MYTVATKLIPHLTKLRSIKLPYTVLTKDLALTKEIVLDFLNREKSVAIGVYPEVICSDRCPHKLTENNDFGAYFE